MFTFGRDHEKKTEARYVRDPKQVPLLLAVVDAVHDLIEGKGTVQALKDAIRIAFVEGGAGVWENTEKWLRKASQDYPDLLQLWPELAAHPNAIVRFRVACVLDQLPEPLYSCLSPALKNDRSAKVAQMALDRIAVVGARNAT